MRIAASYDTDAPVARALLRELRARRWNDAGVLARSLRLTSEPLLKEILDARFADAAGRDDEDVAAIAHLGEIERAARTKGGAR